MVEFGDELIIESYKVPWLMWIQLLVMILLIVLLFFGFVVFSPDPSTASRPTARIAAPPTHLSNPTSSNVVNKPEDRRVRRDAATSGGSNTEDDQSGEDSSLLVRIFRSPDHPCNYFGLAKKALFKCFGLDSSSESSSNSQHEKQE